MIENPTKKANEEIATLYIALTLSNEQSTIISKFHSNTLIVTKSIRDYIVKTATIT